MAPPPPKVKISNLMQAAKDEAVADPSAMEAKVRAEMAQRIKNHEERNAARKLTPQEKRDKKKRKLTNDPSSGGVPVSLCARRPPPEYPPMSPHVTLTRHSLKSASVMKPLLGSSWGGHLWAPELGEVEVDLVARARLADDGGHFPFSQVPHRPGAVQAEALQDRHQRAAEPPHRHPPAPRRVLARHRRGRAEGTEAVRRDRGSQRISARWTYGGGRSPRIGTASY